MQGAHENGPAETESEESGTSARTSVSEFKGAVQMTLASLGGAPEARLLSSMQDMFRCLDEADESDFSDYAAFERFMDVLMTGILVIFFARRERRAFMAGVLLWQRFRGCNSLLLNQIGGDGRALDTMMQSVAAATGEETYDEILTDSEEEDGNDDEDGDLSD